MMYFPSSGRRGFDHFRDNQSIKRRGTKQELIAMLEKENKLRMSEEWIEKMEQEINEMKMSSPLAGYKFTQKSPVITALQTEVVKSFGYTSDDEIKEAILRIQTALATYPNDEQITNAANYLKYNRIEKGDWKINDIMPTKNTKLLQLSYNNIIIDDENKQENKDNNNDEKYTNILLDDILNKKNKGIN
eukprot:458278_1